MDKIILLYKLDGNDLIMHDIVVALIILISCIVALIFYKLYKRSNEEYISRKDLYSTFGLNINDAFWIYNKQNSKYEYISPNFEDILEISDKVLRMGGINMLDYISPEKREKFLKLYSSPSLLNMSEEEYEIIKPKSKTKCWILLRIYPILNKYNSNRYICIAKDITKEKLLQHELVEALIKLQNANDAKNDFLSHMSHELKNPINAIIGMTQIASYSLENHSKVENCLNKIDTSSRILLKRINNILDISKIDSEKLILEKEPFHLNEVLISFCTIMKEQATIQYLNCTLISDNIQDNYLLGDSLRLIQILENCISNSIKFTPIGGSISLKVSEIDKNDNNAKFCFVVSDTGKGMSEKFLERIFEPYEQEDSSITKKYGGAGIGMTITKSLVELMGGTIKVDSKINIGTSYTIIIDFAINHDVSNRKISNDLVLEPIKYECIEKRALVVEDNEINLEITSELLNNYGIKVETTENGYNAIKLFESSQEGYYDIILMDLHMPDLNGYETAKAIRNTIHPDAKTVCIIAQTADDFLDHELSIECGMNYHITKPIDMNYLYSLIK